MPDNPINDGDIWVHRPMSRGMLTDPPIGWAYLAAQVEWIDHRLQTTADRMCVTYDPNKVRWSFTADVFGTFVALVAAVEPMTFTCVDCGRTTQDPDRWDPDAVTGDIRCDPCWYAR